MNVYAQIYEFGASAGALEGYVYRRDAMDRKALGIWIQNLVSAYALLTPEVRSVIQPGCDRTLGRAVRSLLVLLGEDHEFIGALRSMVKGPLPSSPDDFEKVKWFQNG